MTEPRARKLGGPRPAVQSTRMTGKHVIASAIVTVSLVSLVAMAGGVDKKHVWAWRGGGNCKGLVRGNDAYCPD